MLCEVCKKNPATVFLTQIVNGKMQKLNLCEACSKEKGIMDPVAFALSDWLPSLGLKEVSEEGEPAAPVLACPSCGFTEADFKKTGKLGCGQCYDTFAEPLRDLIKTIHHHTRHAGKVPARLRVTLERSVRTASLKKELDAAIASENYEAAARIRDQIRQIEAP